MRPFRSRSGTWLLAGAVWLAACAGWWWLLPFVARSWQPPGANYLIGYLSDGKTLLTCTFLDEGNNRSIAGPIRHWNVDSEVLIRESLTPNDRGTWAGLSEGCHWIAILSEPQPNPRGTRHLRLVDAATARRELKFSVMHNEWAISPNGRWLAFSHADKIQTVVFDLESGSTAMTLPERCLQMKFATDNSQLATMTPSFDSNTSKVRVLKVPGGAQLFERTIPQIGSYVHSFSPDGAWLLVGENPNGVVRVLEVPTGREHLHVPACAGPSVVFSADSQSLLAIRKSPLADSWHLGSLDLLSRDEVPRFELGQTSPSRVIWHDPNAGRYLIVWSHNRQRSTSIGRWFSLIPWIGSSAHPSASWTAQLIDSADWSEMARWDIETQMPILVSPTGDTVAIAPSDGVVQIWDVPPHKSLTWFAAGVAILALPIALIARPRIRKLRAA